MGRHAVGVGRVVRAVHVPPGGAPADGVSPLAAATLIGVIRVAGVVERLSIGALADRVRRVRMFQASFTVLAVSFVI
jgi:hypothetical protein